MNRLDVVRLAERGDYRGMGANRKETGVKDGKLVGFRWGTPPESRK